MWVRSYCSSARGHLAAASATIHSARGHLRSGVSHHPLGLGVGAADMRGRPLPGRDDTGGRRCRAAAPRPPARRRHRSASQPAVPGPPPPPPAVPPNLRHPPSPSRCVPPRSVPPPAVPTPGRSLARPCPLVLLAAPEGAAALPGPRLRRGGPLSAGTDDAPEPKDAAAQPRTRQALAELMAARTQLRRFGTNVNQAVAALHTTGEAPEWLAPAVEVTARAVRRVDEAAVRLCGGDGDCPYEPPGGDCPVTRAVVAVALGWAATGTSRPMPLALLAGLVQQRLAGAEELDSRHLARAVEWACAPTLQGARLPRPVAQDPCGTVWAHPQVAEIRAAEEPPAPTMWTAALDEAVAASDCDAVGRIGFQAHVAGEAGAAAAAWAHIVRLDEAGTEWLWRAAGFSRTRGEPPRRGSSAAAPARAVRGRVRPRPRRGRPRPRQPRHRVARAATAGQGPLTCTNGRCGSSSASTAPTTSRSPAL
jgi:hypothetical protein